MESFQNECLVFITEANCFLIDCTIISLMHGVALFMFVFHKGFKIQVNCYSYKSNGKKRERS